MSSARVRRQMREYLHSRMVQSQQEATQVRKERLKKFMEQGKTLPRDLRDDALSLLKATTYDDIETEDQALDDEYANIGLENPLVSITTSRDAKSPIKKFAKELAKIIPNSININRGQTGIKELVDQCRLQHITDILIVQGTHGIPDSLVITHLPTGPTAIFSLINVRTRKQMDNPAALSSAFPHLIFEGLTSKLGIRVSKILKALFPVPKPETHRILSFINNNDWISFRQHSYKRISGKIELAEIGPQFEMRPYKIILGTIDSRDADTEYALRSFIRTHSEVLKAIDDESEDGAK